MSKSRRFQPHPSTNNRQDRIRWECMCKEEERELWEANEGRYFVCLAPSFQFQLVIIGYYKPIVWYIVHVHTWHTCDMVLQQDMIILKCYILPIVAYSSNVDIDIHCYHTTGIYPCIVHYYYVIHKYTIYYIIIYYVLAKHFIWRWNVPV